LFGEGGIAKKPEQNIKRLLLLQNRYNRLKTALYLRKLASMEITNTEERHCLFCSKRLVGRKDKLFCDTDCKNNYHNLNSTDAEKTLKRIIKILKKNRDVLKDVLGTETTLKTSREKLEAKGYEMEYLTHIKEIGAKKRKYYYVLDYGYRVEDDGMLTVVKAFR
jgi:hypothetical protein